MQSAGAAADGERFAFGENWWKFLRTVDGERIAQAESSLREMLGAANLEGRTFIDVGCGSGLFSLAAMRLGAARVVSFDYDDRSVACCRALKERFFPNLGRWTIERGDILDTAYLDGLGTHDVVYAWGVLHHTGDMWRALGHAARLVGAGGLLFVAIYRAQGWLTPLWRAIKRAYNSGWAGRWAVTGFFCPFFAIQGAMADIARLRNPLRRYVEYKRCRGMSRIRDWIDWIGGYPFEVASPDELFRFYKQRGFALEEMRILAEGHGCNEMVFRRV